MSFKCNRCDHTFESEIGLARHYSNSKLPCDLLCQKCGIKQNSKSTYRRHVSKPCAVNINKILNQQKNMTSNTNATSNSNASTINGNHNHNHQQTQYNNITINLGDINTRMITRIGFTPIEHEQPDLLKIHQKALNSLFTQHVSKTYLEDDPNANKTLLSNIIKLFHSNSQTPENINIVDIAEASDYNKVHDGIRLIDDLMPKNIRKKRVLQLIIIQIEQYVALSADILAEGIISFIQNEFIPYIKTVYAQDEMSIEFQQYWRTNNEIIKLLDNIPPNLHPITNIERVRQYTDYNENNKFLSNQYIITDYEKTKKEIEKVVKKMLR